MLRDREFSSLTSPSFPFASYPSHATSLDPSTSSMSLFDSPQRMHQLSSLDLIGSMPFYGSKVDLSENIIDTDHPPTAATTSETTRNCHMIGVSSPCDEEPEQEQEGLQLNSNTELLKSQVHVIKRRNVGVPKFLRFLFQILQVENPVIITWSHEGTAFQIIQPEALANEILPKYFKHNKVSSFQRQLNYFGFKKWTKTQTNVCTFSHPFFVRADKDRMKLIKRKERTNYTVMSSSAMAASIKSNPIDIMNHIHAQEKAREQQEIQFDTHEFLAESRGQVSTQQSLKRQKSNTLSGATVTFLNSAAAGRRHSTGMLPGSEAFGLAAAAAAAASSVDSFGLGRKRAGTPAEQEFELEMEARSNSTANLAAVQQQFTHMRKIAETKELPQRYSYPPAHGKRQSLPHVLPHGFGSPFSTIMNGNVMGSGSFGPRSSNILGRRKSDQLLNDYSSIIGGAALGNKLVSISQIEDYMASSSASASPQTAFASNNKNDASVTLPVSSNSVHDAYQLQQQRQSRQQINRQQHFDGGGYGYDVKPQYNSRWPTSVKPESSNGWPPTSVNADSSSIGNNIYQPQNHSMMMPLKFGGSNVPQNSCTSFTSNITGSMDFSHTASGDVQKLQQRRHTSYAQQYESHQGQVASFHQLQQQQEKSQQGEEEEEERQEPTEQPRDYIDVLLESAGVDDTLPPQSSTMLSSESWNGQSETDPGNSGSTESFSFLQTQQQLQLSPMRGMAHNPIQRF